MRSLACLGHQLSMSALLTGVQVSRFVLVWRPGLDLRGVSGPARRLQRDRPGTGSFFIRSEPSVDRGDEGGEGAIRRSELRSIRSVAIEFYRQWMPWLALALWARLLVDAGVFFSCWLSGLRVRLSATAMPTQLPGIFLLPHEPPLMVADSDDVLGRASFTLRAPSSASCTV